MNEGTAVLKVGATSLRASSVTHGPLDHANLAIEIEARVKTRLGLMSRPTRAATAYFGGLWA